MHCTVCGTALTEGICTNCNPAWDFLREEGIPDQQQESVRHKPQRSYVFQEYPKVKYRADGSGTVVNGREEEAALGEGWYDSPSQPPKKEPAKETAAQPEPPVVVQPPKPCPGPVVTVDNGANWTCETCKQRLFKESPVAHLHREAPSYDRTPADFVAEAEPASMVTELPPAEPAKPHHLSKCACGSGKRYHACCGRN